MEKQRAARTASLNKQLECGCPDSTASDKPCIHQQQAIAASGGGNGGSGGHGRKVQATKSEAHTTSGGNDQRPTRAPSSRAPRGHHAAAAASNQRLVNLQRMQQQLRGGGGGAAGGGDNNNHGGTPSGGGSYSQVSSTTENLDVRQSPDAAVSPSARSARSQQETPPHLVLSVSQVQTSNGLLILNSQQNSQPHAHAHLDPVTGHMIPPGGGGGGGVTHLNSLPPHLAYPPHPPAAPPPPPPRSESLDGGSSAVSSAVRSLNSLSDFTLDVSNGNYGDPYPPPVVTDTMLGKGHEGKEGHGGLLDFKPDGGGLDMSHEDIQRTLQANMPLPAAAAAAAAAAQNMGHNGGHHNQPLQQPHPVDLNPMDFIEHDVVAPPHPPPPATSTQPTTADSRNFDMNLDAFDVFGDFSDLQDNNYHQQQPHLNKIKRGDAEHLAQITEYSPDWAWSDVSKAKGRFVSQTCKTMGT